MEKVKDLSVEELKVIIKKSVEKTIEDYIEDIIALSSPNYIKSIEEARKDYKEGKFKDLEEFLDV